MDRNRTRRVLKWVYPQKQDILNEIAESKKRLKTFEKYKHYKKECVQITQLHINFLKNRLKNKEFDI